MSSVPNSVCFPWLSYILLKNRESHLPLVSEKHGRNWPDSKTESKGIVSIQMGFVDIYQRHSVFWVSLFCTAEVCLSLEFPINNPPMIVPIFLCRQTTEPDSLIIFRSTRDYYYPPSFLSRYLERLVKSLVYLPYRKDIEKLHWTIITSFNQDDHPSFLRA